MGWESCRSLLCNHGPFFVKGMAAVRQVQIQRWRDGNCLEMTRIGGQTAPVPADYAYSRGSMPNRLIR